MSIGKNLTYKLGRQSSLGIINTNTLPKTGIDDSLYYDLNTGKYYIYDADKGYQNIVSIKDMGKYSAPFFAGVLKNTPTLTEDPYNEAVYEEMWLDNDGLFKKGVTIEAGSNTESSITFDGVSDNFTNASYNTLELSGDHSLISSQLKLYISNEITNLEESTSKKILEFTCLGFNYLPYDNSEYFNLLGYPDLVGCEYDIEIIIDSTTSDLLVKYNIVDKRPIDFNSIYYFPFYGIFLKFEKTLESYVDFCKPIVVNVEKHLNYIKGYALTLDPTSNESCNININTYNYINSFILVKAINDAEGNFTIKLFTENDLYYIPGGNIVDIEGILDYTNDNYDCAEAYLALEQNTPKQIPAEVNPKYFMNVLCMDNSNSDILPYYRYEYHIKNGMFSLFANY